MRLALVIACLAGPAWASTLMAVRPGVMCISADALGRLTLPDGSSRLSSRRPQPGDETIWLDGGCIDIQPRRTEVTLQIARRNTSIVTYQSEDDDTPAKTYIVPNIDFAAAPPPVPRPLGGCIREDSALTLTGELRKIHNRDKRTGQPYRFFSLHLDQPVCLAGADLDEKSTTPTQDITVLQDAAKDAAFDARLGRVTLSGRLDSSNYGGPQLAAPVFR